MARILMVEGNTRPVLDRIEQMGHSPTGIAYAQVLKELGFHDSIDIIYPNEDGPICNTDFALSEYSGIVWTGSAINAYNNADAKAIINQRTLAKDAYNSGTPVFGSCWGMQIMSQALGGTVIKNPNGRELGVSRNITLNEMGQKHPMFADRGISYDQLSVHTDIVSAAPSGAVVLSYNDNTAIQSMAIEGQGGTFWGTQYHPEFDFLCMSGILHRYGQRLVDDGYFTDMQDLDSLAQVWQRAHNDPDNFRTNWLYGFSPDVTNSAARRLELHNWLSFIAGR